MSDETNAPEGATDDANTPAPEVADTGAATETTTTEAQPEKKATPWYQQRIDQLTREKHEARREAEAHKRELEIVRAMRDGAATDAKADAPVQTRAQLTQADLDRLVEQRAEVKAREAAFNAECNKTYATGKAEFPDFDDTIRTLNGAFGDKIGREFLDGINALPNGHQVYHMLGQDPDEAARILALPPIRMAVELARMSDKASKPRPVSGAPAPVKPVDSRGARKEWNLSDEDIPMAEFVRLREKQEADLRKR